MYYISLSPYLSILVLPLMRICGFKIDSNLEDIFSSIFSMINHLLYKIDISISEVSLSSVAFIILNKSFFKSKTCFLINVLAWFGRLMQSGHLEVCSSIIAFSILKSSFGRLNKAFQFSIRTLFPITLIRFTLWLIGTLKLLSIFWFHT